MGKVGVEEVLAFLVASWYSMGAEGWVEVSGMDVGGGSNVWVDVGANNYFWILEYLPDEGIDSVKES